MACIIVDGEIQSTFTIKDLEKKQLMIFALKIMV